MTSVHSGPSYPRPNRRLSPDATWLAPRLVGIAAICGIAGTIVAVQPRLAVLLLTACALGIWAAIRRDAVWWDIVVVLVAGVLILDYGFANVGLGGPIPIPLVDVLIAALVLRAATSPRFTWPTSLPFVLALSFIVLTLARIIVDFPRFGVLAVRDASLGTEVAVIFVGYWAISEYGLRRVSRMLAVVLLVAIPLTAPWLPWQAALAASSPTVGLQRPVPLFGNFIGSGTVAAAAFLFLVVVRPFGMKSYVAAVATIPTIMVLQLRGLYIAIPLAIAVIWFSSKGSVGAAFRRRIVLVSGLGAIAFLVFLPFAPQGRLGQVSPSFVMEQLATLAGREGEGTGTSDIRKVWLRDVLAKSTATPSNIVIGQGLGVDLTNGFKARQLNVDAGPATPEDDYELVRKPHNDFLEVFARYGIVGFGVFMVLLGSALVRIVRVARASGGLGARFLWFAVGNTVVFGFVAATQPYLSYPWGTVPLFFVLGAALAVVDGLGGRPSPSRRAPTPRRRAHPLR